MDNDYVETIGKYINQTITYCENLVNQGICGESDVEKLVDILHKANEAAGQLSNSA